VLFYDKPEINKLSEVNFDQFNISPDFKNIIASSTNHNNYGIWLIDIKSRQSKILYPKENDINQTSPISKDNYSHLKYSNFKWSPKSKNVIFSIKDDKLEDTVIIDINGYNEPMYMNSFFDLVVKDVQWKNDNEVYLLDESGNVHQIELNLNYESKIILKNVISFEFNNKNNTIIYISKEKNGFQLKSFSENINKNILNLPKDENFEIGIGKDNYLALLLKNKKELILINTETNEPKIIGNNINTFEWSKNKNKLLFFGNNELWFYALKKENASETTTLAYNYNEPNLLTRYSTEIKSSSWYPNEEYIAILLENNIKIIELDGRETKNCQEYKDNLLATNYFIEFDKKGKYIYLIDHDNTLQEVKITEF
jgi:hypothetical protein